MGEENRLCTPAFSFVTPAIYAQDTAEEEAAAIQDNTKAIAIERGKIFDAKQSR